MNVTPRKVFNWALSGLGILVLLLVVIVGATWGFKSFGRSQDTAQAKNQARIAIIKADNQVATTNIQINTQAQQLKVHQETAAIRQADAVGIREAQNQISGTLTPLYVQWEMTQALVQIAQSGKNSSVIYIPAGAGGVPLVSGAGSLPAVTSPVK